MVIWTQHPISLGAALILASSWPSAGNAGPLVVGPALYSISDSPSTIQPYDVAVSPDSQHVYVGADGKITAFERDGATGSLSPFQVLTDGVAGVDGVDDVIAVAMSPDGAHLYTASIEEDAIAVFSRNPVTGVLSFVEVQRDGIGGVSGINAAYDVLVSADGAHVYALGRSSQAVAVFSRNGATGALTFLQVVFDGVAGAMGSAAPTEAALSPDGAHLYVTSGSFGDDTLTVFARDAGSGLLTFVEAEHNGAGGVTGMSSPDGVAITPDGTRVYVSGNAGLVIFSRDALTGAVDFLASSSIVTSNLRGLVFNADATRIYVGSTSRVTVLARDPLTDALSLLDIAQNHVDGVQGITWVREVALTPDGTSLYAACRGDGDGVGQGVVVTFQVDGPTGAIDYHSLRQGGQGWYDAYRAVVSPDGLHVYAIAPAANSLALFDREPVSGALTFRRVYLGNADGTDGLVVPIDLAISADGTDLYVVSRKQPWQPGPGPQLARFERNAGDGTVLLAQVLADGVGGVDGLDGASRMVLSPDGAHLYVASVSDDAVAIFARDGVSGALTYTGALFDGVGGVDGLDEAADIAITADGAHVLVMAMGDASIASFARNPLSGALSPEDLHVVPNSEPQGVAVSPDGGHVYVTGYGFPTLLSAFALDGSTGQLSLIQEELNGVGDTTGWIGPNVVVTPDGANVLTSGVSFRRDASSGRVVYAQTVAAGMDPSPAWEHLYGFQSLYPAFGVALETRKVDPVCPPTPLMGCRIAERTSFVVKDYSDPARDRVMFRWQRGETPEAAVGLPKQGTAYGLCVYDETGGAANLRQHALAPQAGLCRRNPTFPLDECWERRPQTGTFRAYEYRDSTGSPDGLTQFRVNAGVAPKAKAFVKGRGQYLRLPALPMTPPVTVQIVNSDGECWSVVYAAGDLSRNDSGGSPAIVRGRTP